MEKKEYSLEIKCKYCDQMYRKHATRQIEHLKKCINCPETVKQLFKSKRNLCEENLNYLFFMFELNIMAIKNFFLCVSAAETSFSVTADSKAMLYIPLQRNTM